MYNHDTQTNTFDTKEWDDVSTSAPSDYTAIIRKREMKEKTNITKIRTEIF